MGETWVLEVSDPRDELPSLVGPFITERDATRWAEENLPAGAILAVPRQVLPLGRVSRRYAEQADG